MKEVDRNPRILEVHLAQRISQNLAVSDAVSNMWLSTRSPRSWAKNCPQTQRFATSWAGPIAAFIDKEEHHIGSAASSFIGLPSSLDGIVIKKSRFVHKAKKKRHFASGIVPQPLWVASLSQTVVCGWNWTRPFHCLVKDRRLKLLQRCCSAVRFPKNLCLPEVCFEPGCGFVSRNVHTSRERPTSSGVRKLQHLCEPLVLPPLTNRSPVQLMSLVPSCCVDVDLCGKALTFQGPFKAS